REIFKISSWLVPATRETSYHFTRRPAKQGKKIGGQKTMLKKTLIAFIFPLLLFLAISVTTPLWRVSAQPASRTARSVVATDSAPTGTLQKMIVENGSVTLNLDLNRLNGINSATQSLQQVRFAVAANSFFPVLIFNDSFRGMEPGSMTLIPQDSAALPSALNASLKRLTV